MIESYKITMRRLSNKFIMYSDGLMGVLGQEAAITWYNIQEYIII